LRMSFLQEPTWSKEKQKKKKKGKKKKRRREAMQARIPR